MHYRILNCFTVVGNLLCGKSDETRNSQDPHDRKLPDHNSLTSKGLEDEPVDEQLGPISFYEVGVLGKLLKTVCSFWLIKVALKQLDGVLEFVERLVKQQHTLKIYVASMRRHLRKIRRNAVKDSSMKQQSTFERIYVLAKRRLPCIEKGKEWLTLTGISSSPILQINQLTANSKAVTELAKDMKESNKRNHREISDDDDTDSDYIPTEWEEEDQIFEANMVCSEEVSKDEPGNDTTALPCDLPIASIDDSCDVETSSSDSSCVETDHSLEEEQVQATECFTVGEETVYSQHTGMDECLENNADKVTSCNGGNNKDCKKEQSSDMTAQESELTPVVECTEINFVNSCSTSSDDTMCSTQEHKINEDTCNIPDC